MAKLNSIKSAGLNIVSNALFTSYVDQKRTMLSSEDAFEKEEILDYLSNYRFELMHVLKSFTTVQFNEQAWPIVDDIFEQGLEVRYLPHNISYEQAESIQKTISVDNLKQHKDSKIVFVPFRIQGASLKDRVYYLFYEALIKEDELSVLQPSKVVRYYFEVTGTRYITKNMLRLYIKSEVSIPANDPGFAYRFVLTTLNYQKGDRNSEKDEFIVCNLPKKIFQQLKPKVEELPFGTKLIEIAKKQSSIVFIEVLKRLPESKRDKLEAQVAGSNKGRYYTLRQLYKPQLSTVDSTLKGEVDIYTHEDSPGSKWARSLKAGSIIYADSDYEESIKTMIIGQPLLICDETSMPAVAAMLERWQSQTVPIVISITNENTDFSYFDEMLLPKLLQNNLDIIYINASQTNNLAQAVIDQIKAQNKKIDCAWGAIGKNDCKPIKKYLNEEHGLKGKFNRVRAYWN